MSDLYEKDFYAWAAEQAAMLRSRNLSAADIAHIAEEIETLGRNERRELVCRLRVLLLHLLKWEFQPERRCRSWAFSVTNTQEELVEHLEANPSLKPKIAQAMQEAYPRARRDAAMETEMPLKTFPSVCPWTFEEAMAFSLGGED